ncbi:Ig-like domain-containing protein [Streptomyces sp. NBC_01754]|uniref:Ig-like domain-containing protein n=1 Tax=Streptomyces sp. NBC_01754 TaxID=2975930 RepID=UPI002DDA3AF6|nr:Ig-like domain-containing protein [Streptomyces sp. NBC_01754]WSC95640.1 Ig-like domain-containing protein [Streptomyces sp. NBC_01754]
MSDWHLLAHIQVAHPERTAVSAVLDLHADTDPAAPVVPGQEIALHLQVLPSGDPYRAYGYIFDDVVAEHATMAQSHGLGHLPNGRFATYASGNEPRAVTAVLKVNDDAPEGAVLLPKVCVGVMSYAGEKLVSSAQITDAGFRVRRVWVPGRSLSVPPGGYAVIGPDRDATEAGLRVVGVGLPQAGTVSAAPDGSITYTGVPGAVGYDRFSVCYENAAGHRNWSEVTVYAGDIGTNPGVLAG